MYISTPRVRPGACAPKRTRGSTSETAAARHLPRGSWSERMPRRPSSLLPSIVLRVAFCRPFSVSMGLSTPCGISFVGRGTEQGYNCRSL